MKNEQRVALAVERIHQLMLKPNSTPMTSSQMKARADNLRQMATTVKALGGQVREDYA